MPDPHAACPMCGLGLQSVLRVPAAGGTPDPCAGCVLRDGGGSIVCPRCGYQITRTPAGAGWVRRMRCAMRHWLGLTGASLVIIAVLLSNATPVVGEIHEPVSRARFLMGTRCEATAYGEGAAEAIESAFDEIARLEGILSDYRDDSELSRLNQSAGSAPVPCSPDLMQFLSTARELSRDTGGVFDITVAPIIGVWDLRGRGRDASRGEIVSALGATGWSRVEHDAASGTVRLPAGMRLDPGALGKGFALDAAARVVRRLGVGSALFDFGGQVLAMDPPPGRKAWEVNVADPGARDTAAVTIHVRNVSVATTGNSERGVHVVDPRTGLPVRGIRSATVIAGSAAVADALSTALFVMGRDEGLRWAASREEIAALYLEPADDDTLAMQATRSLDGYNPSRIHRAGSHTNRRK